MIDVEKTDVEQAEFSALNAFHQGLKVDAETGFNPDDSSMEEFLENMATMQKEFGTFLVKAGELGQIFFIILVLGWISSIPFQGYKELVVENHEEIWWGFFVSILAVTDYAFIKFLISISKNNSNKDS